MFYNNTQHPKKLNRISTRKFTDSVNDFILLLINSFLQTIVTNTNSALTMDQVLCLIIGP